MGSGNGAFAKNHFGYVFRICWMQELTLTRLCRTKENQFLNIWRSNFLSVLVHLIIQILIRRQSPPLPLSYLCSRVIRFHDIPIENQLPPRLQFFVRHSSTLLGNIKNCFGSFLFWKSVSSFSILKSDLFYTGQYSSFLHSWLFN